MCLNQPSASHQTCVLNDATALRRSYKIPSSGVSGAVSTLLLLQFSVRIIPGSLSYRAAWRKQIILADEVNSRNRAYCDGAV